MGNNYNSIAKYYDFISRLVYGQYLVKAQVALLRFIPPNASVLIVGGGTGWILEEIAKFHSQGLQITYIDTSSEMIELAKRRDYKDNKVYFFNKAVEDFREEKKHDVIITAFLFDNFKADKINIIFPNINRLLKPNGTWLYADFVNEKNKGPFWQKFLLKTMYLFFRITCNIETQELVDMKPFFAKNFHEIFSARYFSGFIQSVAYKERLVNELVKAKKS